jgi:serine/threonine protein kinase
MDLAPNGELYNALKRETKFTYVQAQFLAAELILILEHMHSRGVAHRDLKPSNLILDEKLHIKLVDFGTAKFYETRDAFKADATSPYVRRSEVSLADDVLRTEGSEIVVLPTGGTDLTTTPRKRASLVGSEDYVAPEILAG